MFSFLYSWFAWLSAIFCAIAIVLYAVPILLTTYLPAQDLKKKYKTKWAVVSGGSSGIGRAIVEKLALQGFNVVIVAMDDKYMVETFEILKKNFPNQEFRKVCVNLGISASEKYDYLDVIAKATEDIDVGVVFSNAGYLLISAFDKLGLDKIIPNIECNVLSHVKISHLFYSRMVKKQLPGAIVFTASASSLFPAPFSAIYGAEKAFIESFATSLAIEGQLRGIDVMSLIPGYVKTNLYENTPKLSLMKFFQLTATTPADIAEVMFRSVGRVYKKDTGVYTFFIRHVGKIVDFNIIVPLIAFAIKFTPDYKNFKNII